MEKTELIRCIGAVSTMIIGYVIGLNIILTAAVALLILFK